MDSLRHVYDVQTARLVHLAPTVHGSGTAYRAWWATDSLFWHFGTRCAILPLHVPSVVPDDHLRLRCHIVVSD